MRLVYLFLRIVCSIIRQIKEMTISITMYAEVK